MLYQSKLSLNWNLVEKVCPVQKSLESEFVNLERAQNQLLSRTGEGSEFTDWIPFLQKEVFHTIEQQKTLVERVQQNSDAIVVIGIGGSLLGSRAIYEALTNSFAYLNTQTSHTYPQLIWAGHHLASDELLELCQSLDKLSPTLVVISKSGGTTEPALAFRILKDHLDKRYGEKESQKRIVVITDPQQGTLFNIAHQNSYPTLSIPRGIGGRYSVFTSVGLFPLALAGIPIDEFVSGARDALEHCLTQSGSFEHHYALCYAGIRNILYQNQYKIESLCTWTPKAKGLAEWWKQLFGESDGKNGTGLFPTSSHFTTDLHSLGQYFQDGERHLFATHLKFQEPNSLPIPSPGLEDGFEFLNGKHLSFVQEKAQEGTFLAHSDGKIPVLCWSIAKLDAYCLGAWMFTNMFACAVGGYARGINPFNQPGVENYKKNMFTLMGKAF